MRKRRAKKLPSGYISSGKFQTILERKYGLKISKKDLVEALAAPPSTIVVLDRVDLPKPRLILPEKPSKRKPGRHSYLHKQRLKEAQLRVNGGGS